MSIFCPLRHKNLRSPYHASFPPQPCACLPVLAPCVFKPQTWGQSLLFPSALQFSQLSSQLWLLDSKRQVAGDQELSVQISQYYWLNRYKFLFLIILVLLSKTVALFDCTVMFDTGKLRCPLAQQKHFDHDNVWTYQCSKTFLIGIYSCHNSVLTFSKASVDLTLTCSNHLCYGLTCTSCRQSKCGFREEHVG